MSGDVQPRKRKDKKKKKDDLGIEEPRGTAAALGEGDIFMHSYQEHGTGGHWCAKVIFFSLLAVLVTLIGLIILENRGLSELEANSVETRYSGVLEGWLEDGHDGDHHDEHTLELKHHDDEDDDDHDEALDHDEHGDEELSHEEDDEEESNEAEDDDEENQDDDQDENEDDNNRDNDDDDDNSQEADDDDNEDNLETAEDEEEVEEKSYRRYYRSTDNQVDDDDDDDDKNNDDDQSAEKDDNDQQIDENEDDDDDDDDDKNNDDDQSAEKDDNDQQIDENEDDDDNNNSEENNDADNDDDDDNNSQEIEEDDDEDQIDERNDQDDENEHDEDDEDHEDHNDHEEDPEVELEHIEEEVFDEDVAKPAPPPPARVEPEESEEDSKEAAPADNDDDDDDDIEMLEPGDIDDLPEELPIPVPKGRPLVEVEDSPSTEKPHDTLAEEEEYERQQEALRKEKEEASQGMWLKLVVGGALLVATQAVLRRATAPRDNEEGDTTREATPLTDRRMTLITEPVPPRTVTPKPQELSRSVVEKEVVRQAPIIKSAPPPPPEEEEEELDVEEEEEEIVVEKDDDKITTEKNKELYSDEEEVEDEEEEEFEPTKPIAPVKEPPKPTYSKPVTSPAPAKPPVKEIPEKKEPPKVVEKESTPEKDEEDDDVEIIEEEDIGEDLEEEEDDISDVDDAELLSRLEAKYGRLPEPERPGKQKDGGNSIEDEWPGEPSGAYWREELDQAERDLRQGEWTSAAQRASAAELRSSGRARFLVARAYDQLAEAKRDNGLLSKAVAAYLELLKMNEKLTDKKLMEVAERTVDRMKFRGSYLSAEPVYRLLIRRFPNNPSHRNNLTISFLMANRMDLAEEVIKETLKQWPDDRIALANYGFILKTLHKNFEKAVEAFSKALEGDIGDANESRYYYHLGDALLLLGRFKEAHEVHKRGAKLGHFLSPAQRSLYNVNRLKSKPWWDVEKTPYKRLAHALEKSWKEILKEGRAAQAMYEEEKEGLREKGEWSQLDLFARGREVAGRCARAPITCGIVRSEGGASGCRRGQIKFSLMEPGTHVRPHVGPTNCRLRMHLGLSNTRDTYIRVDQEIRQWQVGKVLMFDDSFEHEVWHNGTGARLVLIVDVWHPDLTRAETHQLPAI